MSNRPIILTVVLVVVAMAGIWIWRLTTAEPMSSFRDFPWTYITEAAMGTDEKLVIIDRGTITGPANVLDTGTNATAWPAFTFPGLPLVDGKALIFPVIPEGDHSRTPVIPALGRPLNQNEIDQLVRFQIPEGHERMEAFRKEMGQ
jgi:hypothetical protein